MHSIVANSGRTNAVLDISRITGWLEQYAALGTVLLVASVVMLVGSLWVAHRFLTTIPADYFTHQHKRFERWNNSHAALRWTLIIGKNALGGLLILAGIVMIFTPGQGILSLLLGLTLIDIPGKRTLERKIIQRPSVLRVVNHLRARAGKPPLEF
jgi:hypothetical protein